MTIVTEVDTPYGMAEVHWSFDEHGGLVGCEVETPFDIRVVAGEAWLVENIGRMGCDYEIDRAKIVGKAPT